MPTLKQGMTILDQRVQTELVAYTVSMPNDGSDHWAGTTPFIAYTAIVQSFGQKEPGNPDSSKIEGVLSFVIHFRRGTGLGDRDDMLTVVRNSFASQAFDGVVCKASRVVDGPSNGEWETTAIIIPFRFDDR